MQKPITTKITISMQNEDEQGRWIQVIYDYKGSVFLFSLKTKEQININFFNFYTFPASQEDFALLFGDFLNPSSFLWYVLLKSCSV